MKKIKIPFLALFFLLSPLAVSAYSDKVIVGGENIGINIKSDGILVVGFYKVDGKSINTEPAIKTGDLIIKVDDIEVNNINELTSAIENKIADNKIKLVIKRDKKQFTSVLNLIEKDGIYKTGLYVKDSMSGIGTLTYIDPETKIFGSLGHEIIEANTSKKIEVKTGSIFGSSVTGITKSTDGTPGEKSAKLDNTKVYGEIKENTEYGLFGNYTNNLPGKKMMEVAQPNEIKIGYAQMLTVLNKDEVKEYEIYIDKINEYNKIKNIHFEITDAELLEKTGGIVQGMSGSPIIQNNKIIGAVTHVIVDNVKTGYGIFITTMLEEGEN